MSPDTDHRDCCDESEQSSPHSRPTSTEKSLASDHSHSHSHSHAASSRGRLIAALSITATVLLIETIGGALSGSLALFADAGHMAVDSTGLVIALIAAHLSLRPRTDRFTWGLARSEVVAAALQAGMLVVICVIIAYEAIGRFMNPEQLDTRIMLIVGILGLAANVASLLVLMGGRSSSLNMRAAFLEVATDALGSVAVIIGAVVAHFSGWLQADALASLLIACMMAPRAITLLRRSVAILMEETPPGLELATVREHMLHVQGVKDVHDLHASTIATGVIALTAHVTVQPELNEHERSDILHTLASCVQDHFPVTITHSTFQLESPQHREHEQLRH